MGKLLGVILIFVAMLAGLVFVVGWIYTQLPGEPIKLTSNIADPEPAQIIDYGDTPVFSERLRFNHNNISFHIDSTCSSKRSTSMREAFEIFEEEIGMISFRETTNVDADISIGCSDDFIKLGENMFAAGEGGPVNITNTTNFKTIQKGKIFLYEDQACERPNVELHELLHVFGFDHSENPKSIMYNISRCDQGITPDMVTIIDELYSIVPLPDARISELEAVKKGKYLNFNITVLNEGLLGIEDISLTLLSNDRIIDTIELESIGIGYGRTLRATNLKLFSSNINTIDFVLDYNEEVEELDEGNNIVQMSVSTA